MNRDYAQFDGCYRTLLTKVPAAAGKSTIKLSLGKDGAPQKGTTVSGRPDDASFQACLVKAISESKFTVDGADAQLMVTLDFQRPPTAAP